MEDPKSPASGEPTAGPEAPRLPRRMFRPGMTREAQDRLALFSVRAIFFFIAAGLGLYAVKVLSSMTKRWDLDPLLGIVVSCGTAAVIILVEIFFAKSPVRTLSAVTFGLIIGFVLSLVFQPAVEFIANSLMPLDLRVSDGYSDFLSFLRILTLTIFCYFGVTVLLQTKEDFKFIIPFVEFRKDVRSQTPLVLDTSVFVDGRIHALLGTGIFDHRLVVPTFVLNELQTIADSSDRSLRERGRRGMDMLHEVEKTRSVEILDRPTRKGEDVDSALVSVASDIGGKLVTTDYNLQKSAKVRGVPVVNVNDIAAAVKPAFVPGEFLTVRLLREGEDRGQGVGFLRDGTMVVVEGGWQRIGQEVVVEVTSSLQTSAGKMVFGKLKRAPKPSDAPEKGA